MWNDSGFVRTVVRRDVQKIVNKTLVQIAQETRNKHYLTWHYIIVWKSATAEKTLFSFVVWWILELFEWMLHNGSSVPKIVPLYTFVEKQKQNDSRFTVSNDCIAFNLFCNFSMHWYYYSTHVYIKDTLTFYQTS